MERSLKIQSADFSNGYIDNIENVSVKTLTPPSQNVRLTLTGECISRLGYEDTTIDFAEGTPVIAFYVPQYNITFLSGNGKVKYIDWNRSNAVYDTGLSLTATETTTFAEYGGDVFTINQTDGARQIHVMRLNDAAPNSGDTSITVDQNGGARMNVFAHTTGNLRIRGVNEAYTGVTTAGVVTLTGTLSQTYLDNEIAIVVNTATTVPKGTMIVFWKERMIVIGTVYDTNTDNTAQIAYMSQFASARDLQKILVFGTTGGATEEWVGKSGILKSIVTTRDYMYYFKEDETYFSSVDSVDTTTGATAPQLLSNLYGTYSQFTAVDIGGRIVFLTKNKRIISIDISTQSGAAVVFPNEKFDQAIRTTLELLDSDQSKARMFYHTAARLLYIQVSVQGVLLTLVYDNNIGKWLPPDTNKQFNSFFEKDGVLYATDLYDDTIYELDIGYTDNDQDIDYVMAHGKMKADDRATCEWQAVELSGSLAQGGEISIETIVNSGTSNIRKISYTDLDYSGARAIGDLVIGDMVISGRTSEIKLADWDRKPRISPTSYGNVYQTVLSSTFPFSWKSYTISLNALSDSLLTTF